MNKTDEKATGPIEESPADEVSARRAAQAAREASADFDPASSDAVTPNGDAESIAAKAEAGEPAGEEEDGQTFILEQGRKVTLGTLIGRNVPVTYEVKLTGRTLKGPGSLLAFSDPDVTLVALGRAGRVISEPTYNEDGSVKSVAISQEIKTKTFYDARTEAARVALEGE